MIQFRCDFNRPILYLEGKSGWTKNGNGKNIIGLDLLPGGRTVPMGTLGSSGELGHWWSATETSDKASYMRGLSYLEDGIGRNGNYKVFGFSVRCVKDEKLHAVCI